MKSNKVLAFTLIELIISSLILSCVAVAVYSIFSGGINAWKRGKEVNTFERKLRIISEVMARDIKNNLKFLSIPFEGDKNSVTFAGLIENFTMEQGLSGYELGRVSYFLNEENILCRKQQSYAEIFQEEDISIIKELIPDIQSINFSYLGFDSETDIYEWSSDWPLIKQEDVKDPAENQESVEDSQDEKKDFGIPAAVKIEFEFKKQTEGNSTRMQKAEFTKPVFGVLKFTKTIIVPGGDEIEQTGQEG